MAKEKIEFTSSTPSFIKKLLLVPEEKPRVPKKEPVDEEPIVVNEIVDVIHKKESKIVQIGVKKLKKKLNSSSETAKKKSSRLQNSKKTQLLSFIDDHD